VVVNATARGFKESCGQFDSDANCTNDYTHLADRSFETRDTQTILGKLVDAGIASPSKLAATGGSYGGGQSWLLATSLPWRSPNGSRLQLAAAVPKYPWTDLLDSIAPNGRATAGTSQSEASHLTPFGIPKESYIDGLYAVGRAVGQGRYDSNPTDFGTNLDEQYQRVQQGEPYDTSTDPLKAMQDSYLSRSPFFADAYFNALQAHTVRRVPVLSIQGWTDPLFPAVQTLQMFRRLKAVDPSYPITMVFGDIGHSNAQNPAWQWQPINTLGNGFLDGAVLGRTSELPSAQAYSFRTECGSSAQPAPASGQWDALSTSTLTLQGAGTHTTTSADSNGADGKASDPITNGGCLTENATTTDPGGAYWSFPSGGVHLLGLPTVSVGYSLTGHDATVGFKLWDEAPDGSKTLVTRGEYRLSTAQGDAAVGTLATSLYGNDWVFPSGDTILLQITQADSPYLRPDNLPSSIDWTAPRLVLPTAP
jgi:predicted acyl esterase